MANLSLVQFGGAPLEEHFALPEFVQSFYIEPLEPGSQIRAPRVFDVVVVGRDLTPEECNLIRQHTRPYRLFVLFGFVYTEELSNLIDELHGEVLAPSEQKSFIEERLAFYFGRSYGERFDNSFIEVSPNYHQIVERHGLHDLRLRGNFGTDFTQVLFWRSRFRIEPFVPVELFLEYLASAGVTVQLVVVSFPTTAAGACDIERQEFVLNAQNSCIPLPASSEDRSISVSLRVLGVGDLQVKSLHVRFARDAEDHLLPGGKRRVTKQGEELFFYFNPGTRPAPLFVYFAGHRRQETEEGYTLLKSLGVPFVLFLDTRLSGGAGFIGSADYEELVQTTIERQLKELNLDASSLVLTGFDMGAAAALFYGARLNPRGVIVAKPVVNFGTMARLGHINSPNVFPDAFDLARGLSGTLADQDLSRLDAYFWDTFAKGSFKHTHIAIAHMSEDEYDPSAFEMILSQVAAHGVKITGQEFEGRHHDVTGDVVRWYRAVSQNFTEKYFDTAHKPSRQQSGARVDAQRPGGEPR